MTFHGHSQDAGRGPRRGPLAQRELAETLKVLIDASRAKSATRTRDEARAALRALLDGAHWNTPYVRKMLNLRRRRYLFQLGYPIPYAELRRDDRSLERLAKWGERNG